MARLDTLREATGRIVRDYIAYKWLGDELTQKSIPRILRGESTSCDFQAVMNLTNASALSPLARRCGGKTGILWSIAYSHSGDAALERKKYAGAFQEYTASVEALGPAAVPAELWYRVAVSGLAGRQADDLVFRASSQAFSKNSTIAPLFKTALYNMLCDRISDLSAPQIKHVLERVYPASEAVGEAMAIANECGPARAATLITVLLRGRPSDRNALQLYSLQLGSRQSAVAIGAATRLAQLSKSHPAQATLFFWKGVTNTPFREKAIAAYRRSGRWQPVDEARRKRWAPRSAEPEPFENLAVEQHRGKTVRIPIAFHPPAIPWKASIETDFIQTLKTGLIESSP